MKSTEKYLMAELVKKGKLKNNYTRKIYSRSIKYFAGYCRKRGIRTDRDIQQISVKDLVQGFADNLVKGNLSPATVHTYLSAVCVALNVKLADIKKPVRKSILIRKSRLNGNIQGQREANNPKHSRLVEFQRATGIRRAELAHLTKGDIGVFDESLGFCIRVAKGKGGKPQLQRILPKYWNYILDFKESCGDGKVFSDAEMNNHIDLHGMRANLAKEAYEYYSSLEDRENLYQELQARFKAFNVPEKQQKQLALAYNQRKYILRGGNRERAIKAGAPLEYDRLALLAVNVFHLSHWRVDVGVRHYLL